MDNQKQENSFFAVKIFYATLFALLIYLSFFFVTQSKIFVKFLVSFGMDRVNGPVKLVEFTFKDHLFDFPEFYQFTTVDLTLEDANQKRWVVYADELSLRCTDCFSDQRQFFLELEGADVSGPESIEISELDVDVDLQLKEWIPWKIAGDIGIQEFHIAGVEAKAFQANLKGFKRELSLSNIWFRTMGGVIKGEIFLESADKLPYSVNMQFVDLDLDQLSDTAEAVKSNIKGVYDGFIEVAGNANQVKRVHGRVILSKNGRIHSRLMKNLVAYLPQAVMTEKLSTALTNSLFIPIDEMEMTFANNQDTTIYSRNHIVSREYSLNANVDIDLQEGTRLFNWKNLIQDK